MYRISETFVYRDALCTSVVRQLCKASETVVYRISETFDRDICVAW